MTPDMDKSKCGGVGSHDWESIRVEAFISNMVILSIIVLGELVYHYNKAKVQNW